MDHPSAEPDELEATGRIEPVAPEEEPLDPRALKELSRRERAEAKAALRRERQEARTAARLAKAQAKAAAKSGRPLSAAEAAAAAADAAPAPSAEDDDLTAEAVEATSVDLPAVEAEDIEPEPTDEPAASAPTDPRARAAQRVQRRLGKDAEKLSAAEARARAREEARRRRAQAKEQGAGIVAEEAVVRPPEPSTEEIEDLAEEASVAEPVVEEPLIEEPAIEEPVAEQPAIEEPAIEEAVAEEPAIEEPPEQFAPPIPEQRIDEPAPVAPAPVVQPPKSTPPPTEAEETVGRGAGLGSIAGIVGLIALGISVLLAVGALLVALGFQSGGLYNGLRIVADTLVGPLKHAFDFSGANADRKEHFLAWGAGSIGYLVLSFIGQAVQRANDES